MPCLLLALLMSAPAPPRAPDMVFPPERKGEVTATLALRVPEQGLGPGRALVRFTLHLRGPVGTEVEGSRLEDALAGWRTAWAVSSWSADGKWADWEQTLELVQVKPGVVPLPGVVLRFRAGPAAEWEEIAWPDLLSEPREVPGPVELPPLPPSPWPGRMRLASAILAGAIGLALLVHVGRRWRATSDSPLSPHQRALLRLAERPLDQGAAIAHLDNVLRGYLEERFGIRALRETNRELLAALTAKEKLPPEQIADLAELLGWFERAKFAGEETTVAVSDAAERAGRIVRALESREERAMGEGRKSGEKRTDAEGG